MTANHRRKVSRLPAAAGSGSSLGYVVAILRRARMRNKGPPTSANQPLPGARMGPSATRPGGCQPYRLAGGDQPAVSQERHRHDEQRRDRSDCRTEAIPSGPPPAQDPTSARRRTCGGRCGGSYAGVLQPEFRLLMSAFLVPDRIGGEADQFVGKTMRMDGS